MLIFVAKTQHFPLTLEDFSKNSSFLPKNSRIFAQNSRIFLKNSRFRKFQELELPEKASKKKPGLTAQNGDKRATSFLFQSISMAVQRGNVGSIRGSVPNAKILHELFYL